MNPLIKILGNRSFWTSASPLVSLVLTKAFHMASDDVLIVVGSVSAICMTIDGALAGNAPETPAPPQPKAPEPKP